MRIVAYIVVGLSLGVISANARAQSGTSARDAGGGGAIDTELDSLRQKVLYAKYAEARGPLEAFVKDTSLSARQRVVAYELLAMIEIGLGEDDAANATLKDLYARDPKHRIDDPNVSPKVTAAFDKARDRAVSKINVQMENIVPTRERLRQQPGVKVRVIKELDAVDELYVYYREGTSREYVRLAMAPDKNGTGQALIPPVNTEDEYNIEFYVEAVAPSGAIIGRMGTKETPLRVTVPAAKACTDPNDPACRCDFFPKSPGCPFCFENPTDTACADDPCVKDPSSQECLCTRNPEADDCKGEKSDSGSVFGEWWFWTIVGVAVAGGAVAGVILLQPDDDPLEGSFGKETLQAR